MVSIRLPMGFCYTTSQRWRKVGGLLRPPEQPTAVGTSMHLIGAGFSHRGGQLDVTSTARSFVHFGDGTTGHLAMEGVVEPEELRGIDLRRSSFAFPRRSLSLAHPASASA